MKIFIFSVFFLSLIILNLPAQDNTDDQDTQVAWIFFRDKGPLNKISLNIIRKNFSQAALERRAKVLDRESLIDFSEGIFDMKIRHNLIDGEQIDLGGLTLVTLYTPGHSPGHLAFYIPEHDLLFSADVDLTSFGPFYGHDFADIDDFIQSIKRLKTLNPKIVATGHAGPFEGDISKDFDDYEEVIYRRERLVLEHLTRPRSLEYFTGRNLIFRSYPEDPHLMQWFELIHVEKHLKRLAANGRVRQEAGKWMPS